MKCNIILTIYTYYSNKLINMVSVLRNGLFLSVAVPEFGCGVTYK